MAFTGRMNAGRPASASSGSPQFLVPELCPNSQMGDSGSSGLSKSPGSTGSLCHAGQPGSSGARKPTPSDSVSPRGAPIDQPYPVVKQDLGADTQPCPEMQELIALQAELEAKIRNTQDPVQRAEAQHVLHAIHALKQAPSSKGSGPKRASPGQQVCRISYRC